MVVTNNSAILFISDIHYTDNKSKSQLCKDNKNEYYQKWENFLLNLEQKEKIKFKYLVITVIIQLSPINVMISWQQQYILFVYFQSCT